MYLPWWFTRRKPGWRTSGFPFPAYKSAYGWSALENTVNTDREEAELLRGK